jgi:hypothetical protein
MCENQINHCTYKFNVNRCNVSEGCNNLCFKLTLVHKLSCFTQQIEFVIERDGEGDFNVDNFLCVAGKASSITHIN